MTAMTRQMPGGARAGAVLLFLLSCGGNPRPGSPGEQGQDTPSALDELRAATRPFTSLDVAVKSGYARNVSDCLVHEHHGAMGYHHVNARHMDGVVDIRRPEILLYERLSTGEYRLNGVEFIVPYRAWPRDSVPPQVFEQSMRREENLQFWYLHVWAWTPNPDGLFADFHPQVRCPADARKVFKPSNG
jgi:hypothetical protein